jgi:hypothetical protein
MSRRLGARRWFVNGIGQRTWPDSPFPTFFRTVGLPAKLLFYRLLFQNLKFWNSFLKCSLIVSRSGKGVKGFFEKRRFFLKKSGFFSQTGEAVPKTEIPERPLLKKAMFFG